MVKDHSDSEKGNPLPPHRLLFPINSRDQTIERKSKEGNGLFNDTLNTFLIRLYGVGHGKGPFIKRERKPAATTTLATLFN